MGGCIEKTVAFYIPHNLKIIKYAQRSLLPSPGANGRCFFLFATKGGIREMAVFRVEKNSGYTVMSNHHLRNRALSLKAKGLLSQMLSLPEDWDYTLQGLARINRESIDAIRQAIRELEQAGYIPVSYTHLLYSFISKFSCLAAHSARFFFSCILIILQLFTGLCQSSHSPSCQKTAAEAFLSLCGCGL